MKKSQKVIKKKKGDIQASGAPALNLSLFSTCISRDERTTMFMSTWTKKWNVSGENYVLLSW